MQFDDKQNKISESLLLKVIRVASKHPETKPHLIPLIKKHVQAFQIPTSLLKNYKDVALAYGDAWDDVLYRTPFAQQVAEDNNIHKPPTDRSFGNAIRDLHFRSNKPMSAKDFTNLFVAICPSYNDFKAVKVGKWIEGFHGIKIFAARESSVCVYVRGPGEVIQKMIGSAKATAKAEEIDIVNGELRLWWD